MLGKAASQGLWFAFFGFRPCRGSLNDGETMKRNSAWTKVPEARPKGTKGGFHEQRSSA